ncbi:hypothetical protein RI129_006667 [Pyrocoelia pectoralis]|uniref:Uncharacterized protein n=1 Tax=Pyrocoelia pectoralis TaxID=417401 RepID=A0AAN7ZJV2_9COLE
MSQKLGKRTKKQGDDEGGSGEFKTPDNTKTKEETLKSAKNKNETTKGGEADEGKKGPVKDVDHHNGENSDSQAKPLKRSLRTRSRSNTPSIKSNEAPNGVKEDEKEKEDKAEEKEDKSDNDSSSTEEVTVKEPEIILKEVIVNIQTLQTEEFETKNTKPPSPSTSVEMDPLILDKEDEEPIPELQFDENDIDVESEGSNSRCKTRRSHSRNISTPKTPRIADQEAEELEIVDQLCDSRAGSVTPKKITPSNDINVININLQPSEEIIDLNDTSDTYSSASTDNLSTKAVAGNDATRNFDFTAQDSSMFDGNTTSNSNFSSRSYADTVKGLSGRRGIHSINRDNYRRLLLKSSVDGKGDIYSDYESVQKITMGIKRKSRSFSPIASKRVKSDSPGFLSYLSSPITNFRHTFKKTSTPQLLMVEKCDFDAEEDFDKIKLENGIGDEHKKWCSIM